MAHATRTLQITLVATLALGTGFGPATQTPDAPAIAALEDRTRIVVSVVPVRVDGTDEQREIGYWALGRYEEAGLDLPPLDIRFHETREPCKGASGLAASDGSRRVAHICQPNNIPRVVLHELAHIWTDEYVDEATRDAFVELRGAKSWATEGDWPERGFEHASEIIMWALLDQQVILFASLGDRDPATLAAHYQFLTGFDLPQWEDV